MHPETTTSSAGLRLLRCTGLRRWRCAAVALLLPAVNALAQQPLRLELGAGVGASFVRKGTSTSDFSPRVLPLASASVFIPLEGPVSFKTGLAYEQKGWAMSSSSTDTDKVRTEVHSRVKLHALTIPFALCYTTPGKGDFRYSFTLGMAYTFFLSGSQETSIDAYKNDRLIGSSGFDDELYIALIPEDAELELRPDRAAYFMFNPAARVEASLLFRSRYALQVFGAYGLSELSTALSNAPSWKLSYCGLALNVVLQKKSAPAAPPVPPL